MWRSSAQRNVNVISDILTKKFPCEYNIGKVVVSYPLDINKKM